jgi:predicted DNA-binding protein
MNLPLRPDQQAHLEKLCKEMGRSPEDFVREAVLTFMEDYEDGRDAQAVLDRNEPTHTLEEVEQHLGLDRPDHAIRRKTA